ncbi:MAG: thiolase domain-containing protein [Euryarchaeota archaeon]|nr:thiolase domain-containing protein [Euryarchaeota archaeon]
MPGPFIASAACTAFGKRSETLVELLAECSRKALDGREADALFVGAQNPEELAGTGNLSTALSDALAMAPRPAVRVECASASGAAVLEQAARCVASGRYRTVLVAAGERMTHLPTGRVSAILAEVLSPLERALGLTMASLAALSTRAYMHRHGLTREELALVPVKSHGNALLNPIAHFRKAITVQDVLESRPVSDPLRVYDCSAVSDGAAAVVLSSERGEVRVAGIGHGTDALAVQHREDLCSLRATREAARQAFAEASCGPGEVDVVEAHDAFSILELIDLEDLGFFPAGGARRALVKGETQLGGALPVNVSGGLKARGHPVGASGLAQVVELFDQLTGNAGRRQVDGAAVGLAQSIGGFGSNNLVTVLRRVGA